MLRLENKQTSRTKQHRRDALYRTFTGRRPFYLTERNGLRDNIELNHKGNNPFLTIIPEPPLMFWF